MGVPTTARLLPADILPYGLRWRAVHLKPGSRPRQHPPHVLPCRHQSALVIGGWIVILAVLRGLPLQLHHQALVAALPQPTETRQPAPRPDGGTRHSSGP
jgi:hypothetical protein